MSYQRFDDSLLQQRRRPAMMAVDQDDDYDEEEAADEANDSDEERGPSAGADLPSKSKTGYVLLTAAGFLPILMLAKYWMSSGVSLSLPALCFLLFALVGFGLSLYQLMFVMRDRASAYVPFDWRTFFRIRELLIVLAVLLPMAIANMALSHSGNSITLASKVDDSASLTTFLAAPFQLMFGNASDLDVQGKFADAVPAANEGLNSGLFLGGALWAALGYAFSLAIAGGLFAVLRGFRNPFGPRITQEVNEETGEVFVTQEPATGLARLVAIPYRFFVGVSLGSTIGFILGTALIVLMYVLFLRHPNFNNGSIQSFLTALGALKDQPDQAFTHGVTMAALMVPFVFLFVGKMTPAGESVSEAEMRQQYAVPVMSTALVPTAHPSPNLISFGELPGEYSFDDEMSAPEEVNLKSELISEFGDEIKKAFGALPAVAGAKPTNGTKDKERISAVLENSLGEISHIPVQVSAELGQIALDLTEWLNLAEGTVLEIDRAPSDEIDILFNGVSKGKGKMVIVQNNIGVEVTRSSLN